MRQQQRLRHLVAAAVAVALLLACSPATATSRRYQAPAPANPAEVFGKYTFEESGSSISLASVAGPADKLEETGGKDQYTHHRGDVHTYGQHSYVTAEPGEALGFTLSASKVATPIWDYSVEIVAKLKSVGNSDANTRFELFRNVAVVNGKLAYGWAEGRRGDWEVRKSGGSIAPNSWFQIVFTRASGGKSRMYLNGAKVMEFDTEQNSDDVGLRKDNKDFAYFMFREHSDSGDAQAMGYSVALVKIWNGALSESSAQAQSSMCSLHCLNGGARDDTTCSCSCVAPWTGSECGECGRTCQHGSVNAQTCQCHCNVGWTGVTCSTCSLTCQNGGALNENDCQCSCVAPWKQEGDCTTCDITCHNHGTRTSDCRCECVGLWRGDTCSESTCTKTCEHGGTIKESDCSCQCPNLWSGDECHVCRVDQLKCDSKGTERVDEGECTCVCRENWEGSACDSCGIVCAAGTAKDELLCICNEFHSPPDVPVGNAVLYAEYRFSGNEASSNGAPALHRFPKDSGFNFESGSVAPVDENAHPYVTISADRWYYLVGSTPMSVYTIEMVVKVDPNGNRIRLAPGLVLSKRDGHPLKLRAEGEKVNLSVGPGGSVPPNTWTHIVMVRDKLNRVRVYVNGNVVLSGEDTDSKFWLRKSESASVQFMKSGGHGGDTPIGSMALLRIYNGAVEEDDILAMNPFPPTPPPATERVTPDSPIWDWSGRATKGEVVVVESTGVPTSSWLPGLTDSDRGYTLSVKAKVEPFTGRQDLLVQGGCGGFSFVMSEMTLQLQKHCDDSDMGVIVGPTVAGGKKYLSVSYDGKIARFYINGVMAKEVAQQLPLTGNPSDSGTKMFIGGFPPGSNTGSDDQFEGVISGVAVWHGVLSDSFLHTRLVDHAELTKHDDVGCVSDLIDCAVPVPPPAPEPACEKTCVPKHGELDAATCTCNCVDDWSGEYCENCSISCLHNEPVDKASCSCECGSHWSGPECGTCNIGCMHGATKNDIECSCECPVGWSGPTCEEADSAAAGEVKLGEVHSPVTAARAPDTAAFKAGSKELRSVPKASAQPAAPAVKPVVAKRGSVAGANLRA